MSYAMYPTSFARADPDLTIVFLIFNTNRNPPRGQPVQKQSISCPRKEAQGKNTMLARPSGLSRALEDQLRKAEVGATLSVFLKAFHLGRLNHNTWYCVNTEEHGSNRTLAAALQCPFPDMQQVWPELRRILQVVMPNEIDTIERHQFGHTRGPLDKHKSRWVWFSWQFFFLFTARCPHGGSLR